MADNSIPSTPADPASVAFAPEDPRRLLTAREVGERLGMTESFARKLIARRAVPIVKLGGAVRVRLADVDAYLEASTRPAVTR